MKINSFI